MSLRVPPQEGGCWFCYSTDPPLDFSVEFDTNVHHQCIREALKQDKAHPEAIIMHRELLNATNSQPTDAEQDHTTPDPDFQV